MPTANLDDKSVLYRKLIHVLNMYIPVEEIPIQYGGHKRENDYEFSSEDGVASELILKASSTATIEIPAPQVLKKNVAFSWSFKNKLCLILLNLIY